MPTGKIPDMNKLNQKEQIVYKEIVDRFHEVFFSEECMVHRTTLDIQCLNEKFRIQGDIYISKGWKQVKNLRTNDREIPDFQKGDNIPINFQPEKKMTTPPKHYTTDTLVKFMDNPFAKDEEIEDEDTMYAADQVIDIGPGAGVHGGNVMAQGTAEEIKLFHNIVML